MSIENQFAAFLEQWWQFPDSFKQWLNANSELNPPTIPVSQISGFTQFTPSTATQIVTSETTASATYVDLATAGPTISNLADGKYIVFLAAGISSSSAVNSGVASISVNASTPTDNDGIFSATGSLTSVMGWSLQTLSNKGSSTVKMQYRAVGGATGTFGFRRLAALKYSNL